MRVSAGRPPSGRVRGAGRFLFCQTLKVSLDSPAGRFYDGTRFVVVSPAGGSIPPGRPAVLS